MPENAQIARIAIEDLNTTGKLELIDQHFDPSYKGHETLTPSLGRDQLKTNVQMYRTAFPDLTVKADEVTAAGEKVLVRWTARGTQKGPFLGAAPTGKQVRTQGITVYTFKNSKIVEEWTQWDALGVIRDLGIAGQVQGLRAQASP
jgi:steroid delta-isomerase-like uncharacterized protein